MTDRKITRIQKITVNTTDVENVLDIDWEFVGPDGGDILEPQFVPNLINALDVEEWDGKHWRFRIVLDSDADIFDTYWSQNGVHTVIPTFSITLEIAGGDTQVWTFGSSKTYVSRKGDSNAQGKYAEEDYQEGVYHLISIGTRVVTHP